MLFFADKVVCKGLTFNDRLLLHYYSVVSQSDFKLSSCLSRNMRTNFNVVMTAFNSCVDGLDAIDKDKSVSEKVKQVANLNRDENKMISIPISNLKNRSFCTINGLKKSSQLFSTSIYDLKTTFQVI